MDTWLGADGRFFNPGASLRLVPLMDGHGCVVVDDALLHPEAVVAWACGQRFEPPRGFPYPGLVADAPFALVQRVADFFAQHARGRLGARRTLDLTVRLCMVTVPPAELEPRQWQCHRDRIAADPATTLFAASVLYLFRDAGLGGTSFYRPRQTLAETERLLADSQRLDAPAFSARYGLQPGYMAGSNAYFERVAQVPAAFNRMVFYDGGLFHSADVDPAGPMSPDPARGRLTLNSFIHCRRKAG